MAPFSPRHGLHLAREMAFRMAVSIPWVELPTISTTR